MVMKPIKHYYSNALTKAQSIIMSRVQELIDMCNNYLYDHINETDIQLFIFELCCKYIRVYMIYYVSKCACLYIYICVYNNKNNNKYILFKNQL